jgi:hypothetical protein
MNLALIIAIITAALTIPVAVAAIVSSRATVLATRANARDQAIAIGKRDEQIERMLKDIERLFERMRTQESCSAEIDKDIAEIRVDIGWIRGSLEEIKKIVSAKGGES